MYKLPKDNVINVEYLYKALDNMTTSYKLFFIKSIIDEIKNNNYEIEFKIIVARMIENSWYMINEYDLNFGKMDRLNFLINNLFTIDELKDKYTKDSLFKYILKRIDNETVDYLMKYVVYRVIRPTFENDLINIKKDAEQQKKIMELSENSNLSIYRVDNKNKKIIINQKWFEYIKNNEKDIQKAIKEQMVEEEKVRREIEKQKQKLEKDQKQFNNEVTRMMKYLQKTSNDAEKELYMDKIRELEEKIKKLEEEKQVVLDREMNARAGFVYIISNIGSFGENIYKIGMTRRLEPMDRIKELSSASVPFEFDVHAMIFSDNAPELENILHQTFRERSVNKVNFRKEFFKVTLDEIEDVVKRNYNKTVDFIKVPTAAEYRQTLEIENNN